MELYLFDEQSQSTNMITFQMDTKVMDIYVLAAEEFDYELSVIHLEYEGTELAKSDPSLLLDLGVSSGQEMVVKQDRATLARLQILKVPMIPTIESLYHLLQGPCGNRCIEITDYFVTAGYDITDLLLHIGPTPHSASHIRHCIRSGSLVTVDCFRCLEFDGPCATDILEQYINEFQPLCEGDVRDITLLMVTNYKRTPITLLSKFLEKCRSGGILNESSSPRILKRAMASISMVNKEHWEVLLQFGGDPADTLGNRTDFEIIRACLAKGATITDDHLASLMTSTAEGLPVLEMLRKEYPTISLTRKLPFCGGSVIPMYIAAVDGAVELAEFITELGGGYEDDDFNPLHVATPVMISYLMSLGADVDFVDTCGNTPLHSASASTKPDADIIVSALLSYGADPNKVTTDGGNSSLHLTNQLSVAKKLVAAGALINVQNDDDETPIDTAHTPAVKSFLRLRRRKSVAS